jgi:hypothetical protein
MSVRMSTLSEAFVVFLLPPLQAGWYRGNAPAVYARTAVLSRDFLGFYEPMLK